MSYEDALLDRVSRQIAVAETLAWLLEQDDAEETLDLIARNPFASPSIYAIFSLWCEAPN